MKPEDTISPMYAGAAKFGNNKNNERVHARIAQEQAGMKSVVIDPSKAQDASGEAVAPKLAAKAAAAAAAKAAAAQAAIDAETDPEKKAALIAANVTTPPAPPAPPAWKQNA